MDIAVIVRKMGFFFGGVIGINPTDNEMNHENMMYAVNPYDECALNMALGIKAIAPHARVIVATPNADHAEQLTDQALSLGADEGVILDIGPSNILSPSERARRYTKALKKFDWQLLMIGIRKIDLHEDELGVYLGAYLNLPVVSGVKHLELEKDGDQTIRAIRRLEKGHGEVVTCRIPAVLTVELTGETRYPTLKKIAAPKKKQVIRICFDDDRRQKNPQIVTPDKIVPPKIRPKKGLVEVDNTLSVADKLGQLFSGGVTEKKSTDKKISGSPDQVAEKMLAHLAEKGFV